MTDTNKRIRHDDSDESDDDFGPMPDAANTEDNTENNIQKLAHTKKLKKHKKLQFEKIFLDNLPSSGDVILSSNYYCSQNTIYFKNNNFHLQSFPLSQ